RRAVGRDDVDWKLRQFARRRSELIGRSVDPPIFERDVAPFHIVQLVHLLAKRLPIRAIVDDADARDLCRGGQSCARTCARGRDASADQRYDLPAIHHARPNRATRLAHSATTLYGAATAPARHPQAGTPDGALSR